MNTLFAPLRKKNAGKRILFNLALTCLLSGSAFSQNMITFYIPGCQLSRFKATDVTLNYAGDRGDVKGSINHITAKGDGIANNLVFGMDMSQLGVALSRGLFKSMGSVYGGVFEVRMGYAAELGDGLKIGAAVDLGAKGINYMKDSVDFQDQYRFFTLGLTVVGLKSFDETVYIMPKLSFNPVYGNELDKITRGMTYKFETTIGYRFAGKLGFSITPGFERMKFLRKHVEYDQPVTIKATKINTSYVQFGLSFMLD